MVEQLGVQLGVATFPFGDLDAGAQLAIQLMDRMGEQAREERPARGALYKLS